jgi:hypothetical protein
MLHEIIIGGNVDEAWFKDLQLESSLISPPSRVDISKIKQLFTECFEKSMIWE